MRKHMKNLKNPIIKTKLLRLIGKEMTSYEDFHEFNKDYGDILEALEESADDWWFEYVSKFK